MQNFAQRLAARAWLLFIGPIAAIFAALGLAGVHSELIALAFIACLGVILLIRIGSSGWVRSTGQYAPSIMLILTCAVGILLAMVSRFIIQQNIERHVYPWISARGLLLGEPMMIPLDAIVRDHPPRAEAITRSIMSIQSIDDVTVAVSLPIAIAGQGRHECTYNWEASNLRNGIVKNLGHSRIGYLPLTSNVTVVEVRASARNGNLFGYLLIRRRDKAIDYEQVLCGTMLSKVDGNEHQMCVKEARYGGKVVFNPDIPASVSNEMLIEYGVPEVDTYDRRTNPCPPLTRLR